MDNNAEIVGRVLEAQGNSILADRLIKDYMPFIKAQTYKAIWKMPLDSDDELSIAMFAFYEAIEKYSKLRGAFLPYASLHIKHKLIDFYRKEKKHNANISMDASINDEDTTLTDLVADKDDEMEKSIQVSATKEEIVDLAKTLTKYELSLSDVANNCPKQERTLIACMKAVNYAKENPSLIDELVRSGKLPLAQLTAGTNVERKTLERHRKYIMALMIIYSNGFEIIRGHLKQIINKEKGGAIK